MWVGLKLETNSKWWGFPLPSFPQSSTPQKGHPEKNGGRHGAVELRVPSGRLLKGSVCPTSLETAPERASVKKTPIWKDATGIYRRRSPNCKPGANMDKYVCKRLLSCVHGSCVSSLHPAFASPSGICISFGRAAKVYAEAAAA